jgi:hypothetical protein
MVEGAVVKRLFLLVLVAAVGIGASLLPRPDPAPEPLADFVLERPGLRSPPEAAIWYCPWAQATTERDSLVAAASMEDATAALTFPVAIPGEPADTAALAMPGPGAAELDLSDVARRGDSPSFIEFEGGPAAASVTVRGDGVLAADGCVATGPDEWHFPGGSTMSGEELRLRVFNPFPETARVTVTAASDVGVEALGDLRGITVNPRSWRDIDFETMLRTRADLVVTVSVDEGLVIPAMRFVAGEDEDWWPGTGLSVTWEFPVARTEGLESAFLVVSNPGLGPVEVTVDLFGDDGPRREAFTQTVAAETPVRFDLSEFPGADLGALVTASGPVAAAVVATGGAGTAVTPGIPEKARRFLLPGLRPDLLEEATLWLLNTSDEPASITVSRLSDGGLVGEKVVLEPGSVASVPAAGSGTLGYLAEASGTFTAAWSITGRTGTAFAVASAVPDA